MLNLSPLDITNKFKSQKPLLNNAVLIFALKFIITLYKKINPKGKYDNSISTNKADHSAHQFLSDAYHLIGKYFTKTTYTTSVSFPPPLPLFL